MLVERYAGRRPTQQRLEVALALLERFGTQVGAPSRARRSNAHR
jgi:hypothetical protein